MSVRRAALPHNASEAQSRRMAALERRVSVVERNPFIRSTSDVVIHSINAVEYIEQFLAQVNSFIANVDGEYVINVNGSGQIAFNDDTAQLETNVNANNGSSQIQEFATSQHAQAVARYIASAYNAQGVVNIAAVGLGGSDPQAYSYYQTTGQESAQHNLVSQNLVGSSGPVNMQLEAISRGSGDQASISIFAICSSAEPSGWTDGFPAGDAHDESEGDLVSQAGITITADGSVVVTGNLVVSGTITSGGDGLSEPDALRTSAAVPSAAPKMGTESFEGNGTSQVRFDIEAPIANSSPTHFVASPRGAWTGEVHAGGRIDDGEHLSLQATSSEGSFTNGQRYHFSYVASV